MPIYEYECAKCGIRFDRLQRFGDPQPNTCPNGHTQVHRLLSEPTVIFKGSGFYVTDNGRNGRSKSGKKSRSQNTQSTTETKAGSTDTAEG